MKLLVISHNPLTTYDNMGKTLRSLLSGFNKDELCQLYIYPSVPNVDDCGSYFRITDKDVMRFYYTLRVDGKPVEPNLQQNDMFEDEEDEKLYRNPKNKKGYVVLARDTMWRFACWNNKNLKSWLKKEKPDCILAAPGNAKFIYDVAIKISENLGVPIVSYLCDEYYFVETKGDFWRKRKIKLLKRKIKQYMQKISSAISICDDLTDLYVNEFGTKIYTVMTGATHDIAAEAVVKEAPKVISYLGNIRCGRYGSLREIGEALDEINREGNTEYKLKIYTGEKNPDILKRLGNSKSIELCGFVSGKKYNDAVSSTDFLLHVESFENRFIETVKNSVSTKIADGLSSGIPMIAYGPSSIASMSYLLKNEAAITVVSKNDLKDTLKKAFIDIEFRKKISENALLTAEKYHNPKKCATKVKKIIEESVC